MENNVKEELAKINISISYEDAKAIKYYLELLMNTFDALKKDIPDELKNNYLDIDRGIYKAEKVYLARKELEK